MRSRSLACISMVLLAQLWSRRADACSEESMSGLDELSVLPATGTIAPRNTRIWVPISGRLTHDFLDFYNHDWQTGDVVIQRGVDLIATTVREVSVLGDRTTALWIFEPTQLLPAGATIDIRLRGELISQFVVSDAEDRSVPGSPVVTKVAASGEYFGNWFCGESSRLTVSSADPHEILILTDDAFDGTGVVPDALLAIGSGDHVTALELSSGAKHLQIQAADLAGNVSTATPLPTVVIPAQVTGCNAGAGQSGGLVVVCLWWIARRRRSRPILVS